MGNVTLRGDRQLLCGWGRAARSAATVHRVRSAAEASAVIADAGPRGLIPRGLGRSYGDAAQVAGGDVIELEARSAETHPERGAKTITVSGGESLSRLLSQLVPQGVIPAVLPGTAHVTIGGAIAADVHGKNHHVDGSFVSHLESMRLLTPAGTIDVSRNVEPELFCATVGGMGLTGLILEATIRLKAIETSFVLVDTDRCADLDELLDAMSQNDDDYEYSVAWLDCTSKQLGRGVLTRGNSAPKSAVRVRDPRHYRAHQPPNVPDVVPGSLLNTMAVKVFNEVQFRKAPRRERGRPEHLSSFFHPLDVVGSWNRVYGRRGLLQYQFVVPFGGDDVIRRILSSQREHHLPSYLAVLKRMGPASCGMLSFPMQGWTLALDFPAAAEGLGAMLREWDDLVAEAGGRIYLAKDSRSSPTAIRAMYADLDEFRKVKEAVDPTCRFQSDLSTRLGII